MMKIFSLGSLIFLSPIVHAMEFLHLTQSEQACFTALSQLHGNGTNALLAIQLQRLLGVMKQQNEKVPSLSGSTMMTDASTMTDSLPEMANVNAPPSLPEVSYYNLFLEKGADWSVRSKKHTVKFLEWAKNNRKKTAGLAAVCGIALSNMYVAWSRYRLNNVHSWSAWSTNDECQEKAFLEALYNYYQPLHTEADFPQLKACFINDTNKELTLLRTYKIAAYCPVLITGVLQHWLSKVKEGCVGFCGNAAIARRLWSYIFGVLRPEYILFGDTLLMRDIDKRVARISELRSLLYAILTQEHLPLGNS
jgi:hypothetical protein